MKILITLLLPIFLFAQNLQIESGSYTGTGSVGKTITTTFAPKVLIIKGLTVAQNAVVYFNDLFGGADSAAFLGASGSAPGYITAYANKVYTLSDNAAVNQLSATYSWIAIAGTELETGSYAGNNSNPRTINTTIDPYLVLVIRNGDHTGMLFEDMGGTCVQLSGIEQAGGILSISSASFDVGAVHNLTGTNYYWMAFTSNCVKAGSFTGDATNPRTITLSAPDSVEWVSISKVTTHFSVFKSRNMGDVDPYYVNFANANTYINTITNDGFEITNNTVVNATGITYRYFAIHAYTAAQAVRRRGFGGFGGLGSWGKY